MTHNKILSTTERKLLLCLFLTICCVFYAHVADNLIDSHNAAIRSEQIEKQGIADNGARVSMFSCGYSIPPPFYVQLFWLQFFTNPIMFFLLKESKPGSLIFSLFINSVMTFSVLAWNLRNYDSYLYNQAYGLHKTTLGYFGLSSHRLAFILAVLSFIFLVLQFSIIVRFAVERFQAKISLR